jgi:lipoprotein-releasing system permease protein
MVQKRAQRLRSVEQWQRVAAELARFPGVTAVSPMASGPAFASRGNASKSVAVLGIEPDLYVRIVRLPDKIISGAFRVSGDEAVIGRDLAVDLGASVGDKIRLAAAEGRSETVSVAGIFDVGVKDLNRRWVFTPLRSAQTLLGLSGGVSNLDLTVTEIFRAEEVARLIEGQTGLVAESWMRTNAQLLQGLRSQSASSTMIQFFVTVSVAFGMASVLVVSVIQKRREIGIIRAMGGSRRQVMAVFLLQGGLVGLVGSVLGSGLGALLATVFSNLARAPDGSPVFPVALTPGLFAAAGAGALLTGVLSAAAPALRAARLDPVEAIREE